MHNLVKIERVDKSYPLDTIANMKIDKKIVSAVMSELSKRGVAARRKKYGNIGKYMASFQVKKRKELSTPK